MTAQRTAPPLPAAAPPRRRLLWVVLAGFGAFFLVTAALFRFWVPGQVIRFPLNEYEIMTLQGRGVSYFSAARLTELSGVTMRATYTIRGDVARTRALGRSDVAVWQSFVAVEDITDHAPFQYTYQQVAFDRRTGALVAWPGTEVGPHHGVAAAGQGYVWPLGTGRHAYRLFDPTLRKPALARYAGTATTVGIATYRFTETVPATEVGTRTLPGWLVGSQAAAVTLPEFYTAVDTFWVDPVTGDPLKISQNQTLTLRDQAGTTRLVLFRGRLTTTPASVGTVAKPDRANLSKVSMIGTIIPLTSLGLGVLMIGGAVLAWRRRPLPAHAR
jgi:Porin PorA